MLSTLDVMVMVEGVRMVAFGVTVGEGGKTNKVWETGCFEGNVPVGNAMLLG